MPLLPAKVINFKEHNSKMEKAVKSKIKLGLPFMVPNLVYKFQMICLWGTYVIKRQPNMGICRYTWDMGKHLMQNNSPSFLTVKWLFPAKSYKHEILKRKQRKSDFWPFDLGELIKKRFKTNQATILGLSQAKT